MIPRLLPFFLLVLLCTFQLTSGHELNDQKPSLTARLEGAESECSPLNPTIVVAASDERLDPSSTTTPPSQDVPQPFEVENEKLEEIVDAQKPSPSDSLLSSIDSKTAADSLPLSTQEPTAPSQPPKVNDSKFLTFNEWKQRAEAEEEALRQPIEVEEEGEEENCPPSSYSNTSPPTTRTMEECPPKSSRRRWSSLFSIFTRNSSSRSSSSNNSSPTSVGEEDAEDASLSVKPPLTLLSPLGSDSLPSLSPRPNYASLDCGASVLSSSRGSRSVGSILSNSPDRYMNAPCAAKEKWVVLELCQEIELDIILVGNLEVAEEIEGRGEFGRWKEVGILKALNIRGLQAFKLPPTSGFYKYVRLDFISHYGSEHFCPVSNVKVYGATQMEVYRREEGARKKMEERREVKVLVEEPIVSASPTIVIEDSAGAGADVEPMPPIIPPSAGVTTDNHVALESLIASLSQNVSASPDATPTSNIEPQQAPQPSAHASNAPTTESIFGAITRRLNALEANATLTMQYLEIQGRWLAERLEKLDGMDGWRRKQESLMSRLLLELQFERAEMERERIHVNSQLMALARDISFEQRLGVAQLFGLLALFFFVAFTRGARDLGAASTDSRRRLSHNDQLLQPMVSPLPLPRTPARKPLALKPIRSRAPLTLNSPTNSKFRRFRSATPPPRFDSGLATPSFEVEKKGERTEHTTGPSSPPRKRQIKTSLKGKKREDEVEFPTSAASSTFRRRPFRISMSSRTSSFEERRRNSETNDGTTSKRGSMYEPPLDPPDASSEYEDISSALESGRSEVEDPWSIDGGVERPDASPRQPVMVA
ncbi:hypothetical protein BT69DRAFT_1347908 [Atractiella rhizophila]|nr:hypothetical protein BT69DRAFT_1347908 [Atractiella rhizophila]